MFSHILTVTWAVFVPSGSEEESGVWGLKASPSSRCYRSQNGQASRASQHPSLSHAERLMKSTIKTEMLSLNQGKFWRLFFWRLWSFWGKTHTPQRRQSICFLIKKKRKKKFIKTMWHQKPPRSEPFTLGFVVHQKWEVIPAFLDLSHTNLIYLRGTQLH